MKTLPLLLVAGAASAAVSTTILLVASPAAAPSSAVPDRADVDATLRDLERSVAALETTLAELRAEIRSAPGGAARAPAGGIDEAVDRWMREHLDERLAELAPPPDGAGAPAAKPPFDLEAVLAELGDPDLSQAEWEAVWKRIREAGRTDEAIAHFERLAALDPSNPDAQVALGGAYLQKIFEVGNSPEAGMLATKADEAFDSALALDSGHWDARFAKAVSLSFWPPVFGKQREAIQNFEILARQQETMSPKPSHAEVYLYLGNLYEQLGQLDQAKEAWKKGASLFPQNADLVAKAGQGGF